MILQKAFEKGLDEYVTKKKTEKNETYLPNEVLKDFNGTSGSEVDIIHRDQSENAKLML